jgi:hypothetical protein
MVKEKLNFYVTTIFKNGKFHKCNIIRAYSSNGGIPVPNKPRIAQLKGTHKGKVKITIQQTIESTSWEAIAKFTETYIQDAFDTASPVYDALPESE